MDGCALEIGQVVDDAWAERACALPPAERVGLLEQADALRDEDGGAPLALACYMALRDDLEPDRADDVERLAWLLMRVRYPNPALGDIALKAAGAVPGTKLWVSGQFRMAQIAREAGRLDEAITRLWTLNGHTAGKGGEREGTVLANLALCLLQQERAVEGFLCARRAVATLGRTDNLRALLQTKLIVASCYARFNDWDRHAESVASVAVLLGNLSEADRRYLEPQYIYMLAEAAFERDQLEQAVELYERFEQVRPERRGVAITRRAYALALLGRTRKAKQLVASLAPDAVEWLSRWSEPIETLCTIADGTPPEVTALVAAYFDRLAAPAFETPGRRVKRLVTVAQALHARGGFERLEKEAYDLAANCVLARMVELERFARDKRPLFSYTREERIELGRLRDTQLQRHEQLRRAVVELAPEMPGDWFSDEGLLALCAWCGCVKSQGGAWVPLGSYLPRDPDLRMTHAMCPACERDHYSGSS